MGRPPLLPTGVCDGVAVTVTVVDGVGLALVDGLVLVEGEVLVDGDADVLGEVDTDGDGLPCWHGGP